MQRTSAESAFQLSGSCSVPSTLNRASALNPLLARELSGLPQVRHGEWSRTDASDIDGLSREAEWSFWGKRHRRQSRDG